MTATLCFLVRLRDGARHADFETFLREVERPLVEALPSTTGQRVLRVDGLFEDTGAAPVADYIDLIEVTDVGRYEADLAAAEDSEALKRFVEGWERLVEGDQALRATEVLRWSGAGRDAPA